MRITKRERVIITAAAVAALAAVGVAIGAAVAWALEQVLRW